MNARRLLIASAASLLSSAAWAAESPPPGPVLKTADGRPCVPVSPPKPATIHRRRRPPPAAVPAPVQCPASEPPPVVMAGPSTVALQQRIDAQQQEIDALKAAAQAKAEAPAPAPASPSPPSRLRFSSFGEASYVHLRDRNPDRTLREFDLDRIAVGATYDFTPAIRLVSMVELEHAATDDLNDGSDGPGDLHMESAYLEFDLNPRHALRTGLFPLPLGIINEHHLPTEYYGVERPVVETEIIPSTWSELGAALNGRFAGDQLAYDLALHSGLLTPGAAEPNAYRARDGLQRGGEAAGFGPASTARLRYIGIQGLELAAAVNYQDDVRQNLDPGKTRAWLYEAHALATVGRLSGRALWAQWNVDGAGPDARGRDVQDGYYLEAAWRFTPRFGTFVQWSEWDPGNNTGDAGEERLMAGFNYWPIPNLVFKFDAKTQDGEDGSSNRGFRVGMGYAF